MATLIEIGLTNAVLATGLAAIMWLVTRLVRNPVLVHALWVLVLLKLVTPPFVSIPWRYAQPTADSLTTVETVIDAAAGDVRPSEPILELEPPAPIDAPSVATLPELPAVLPAQTIATNAGTNTVDAPPVMQVAADTTTQADITRQIAIAWPPVTTGLIAAVWLTGSVVWLLLSTGRMVQFHRALADTTPATHDLNAMAEQVAARLGMTQPFRVRLSEGRVPPLVWPIGRPTIVLSRPLVDELSAEETQTLLAHELAHLRRRDHWIRWLEMVVNVLYWWHPVAWWARTNIRNTEERACDAWVVWAYPNAAERYAAALFKTIEFVSASQFAAPVVASRLSRGGDFTERIENVMSGTCNHRLSFVHWLTLLAMACIALPLSVRAVQAADEPAVHDPAAEAIDLGTVVGEPPEATPAPDPSSADDDAAMHGAMDWNSGQNRYSPLPANASPVQSSRIETEINRRLQRPVQLEFVEVPLEEVVAQFASSAGIDIHLDPRGLDEEGIGRDVPVTISLKNRVSLRSALNLVLEPMHLTYVIEDEVLKVTNERHAGEAADRIKPGMQIVIRVAGALPEEPIAGAFVVESGGTVALGPTYGRAQVGGMTISEAETALRTHLQTILNDPKVQVTMAGQPAIGQQVPWRADLQPTEAGYSPILPPASSAAVAATPDELAVLREHADFLKNQFERIDALYRAGQRGGSAETRESAGYEMASSQAELASAEGRADLAMKYLKQAEGFAEQAHKSASTAYDAGRVTHDAVLKAAHNLTDVKRRLLRLRQPQPATSASQPAQSVNRPVAAEEEAPTSAARASSPSVRAAKAIVANKKAKYERLQALRQTNAVTSADLEEAKTEYEVAVAKLEQAERALRYTQLLVELAVTEYNEALDKSNRAPDTVSSYELHKLKLKVELAKVKMSEAE